MRKFNYFVIANKKSSSSANEFLLHTVGAIGKFKMMNTKLILNIFTSLFHKCEYKRKIQKYIKKKLKKYTSSANEFFLHTVESIGILKKSKKKYLKKN